MLKSIKPSVFFEALKSMNQLSIWFPEVKDLIGIPQNEQYHPEGDVWNHTMQVLDEAAALRKDASEPLWFLLSALCHDFGKQLTTSETEGTYHAYQHEKVGVPLVQQFLRRMTKEVKLTEYVLNMTKLHMEPGRHVLDGAHTKSFMKMFDKSVYPRDLILLAKADSLGRAGAGISRDDRIREFRSIEKKLNEMLQEYDNRMSRPYLMGRDLIEAGMSPSPVFTDALSYAHKLRLAGLSKEEQLRQTLGLFAKKGERAD